MRATALIPSLFLLAAGCSPPPNTSPATLPPVAPVASAKTGGPLWSLDPAEMTFPDGLASGNVRGAAFRVEKAELRGGVLTLRQGKEFFADASVNVFLFLRKGESPAGKTFTIDSESEGSTPHVHVERKSPGDDLPKVKMYMEGYALRLEFGPKAGGKIAGRIYLCVPDKGKTVVAGTFEAEIR